MVFSPDAESRRGGSEPRWGDDNAVARVLKIVAITALVLLLLWIAGRVLLVVFAGVLLGVLLRGVSHWLGRRSFLSDGWALAVVTASLALVIGVGGWLLAPNVAGQLDQLWNSAATYAQSLRGSLSQYSWGRSLIEGWSGQGVASNLGGVLSQVMGVASSVVGALGTVAVIFFIGLYTAADPGLYQRGAVRLFPPSYRPRAAEVLQETGHALRRWLLGRAAAMLVVGAMATIGLWLLDVPLALTLGLLAGLLDFVPYIGPVIAGGLAVLSAAGQGASQALYVVLLYTGIQAVEGYLLTPLIQQRAVSMPPALLLSALILLGALFGGLGVALATPLAAVALVATRMIYIEDVLGDRSPGKPREG